MSVKNGQFQKIGDEKGLGKKPIASPSADPSNGQFQMIGDSLPLSRKSVQSPSANPSSGQFQMVGDSTSMNRTPIKGWSKAANLPMSHRAIEQSKTAANRGKGKR